MTFIKKGIAMLLTLSMLLGLSVSVSASEVSISDKQGFAVSVAKGFGFIDDSYTEDKEVTLGEFKTAIDMLLPDGGYANYYFLGTDDTQKVKTVDAVKVMCDILGYAKVAELTGDLDRTIQLAESNRVVSGVPGYANGNLKLKDLVRLFYNTLEAYPSVLKMTDASKGAVYVKSDKRYMESVLDLYKADGVVQRTSYSSVTADGGTGRNLVVVGGTTYSCETAKFEAFVGKYVKMLVRDNDDIPEIIAMQDNSEEAVINADDIISASVSGGQITYRENGRRKTVNLTANAAYMYNFKFMRGVVDSDLEIKQGRLVLIDNNKDKKYDVVKIEEYKAMKIFSVSTTTGKISGADGKTESIKEMVDNGYPIYDGSKLVEPQNIPLGTVATYWCDKNGEVMQIEISRETMSGTIKEIDREENIIKLEEAEYAYSDEVEAKIEALQNMVTIEGSLNIYKEIIDFKVVTSTWKYGYLTGFGYSDEGDIELKIFTEDGEFINYGVADKITCNGERSSADALFGDNDGSVSTFRDEAGKLTQIIKYKADSKKRVTKILTATDTKTSSESMVREKDGVYRYYATPRTIAGDVRLNEETKVFAIPTDLSYRDIFKAGRCDVMERLAVSSQDLTCQIYDVDNDRYAGLVIVREDLNGKASINDFTEVPYIVESVGTCIDEYGDGDAAYIICRSVTTAEDAEPVKMIFNSSDLNVAHQSLSIPVSSMKPGDVFLASGEDIYKTNVKMLYRAGVTTPYEDIKGWWNDAQSTVNNFYGSANMFCAGKIVRKIEKGFIANFMPDTAEYGAAWNRVVGTAGTEPVWIIEQNGGGNTLSRGSVADINDGEEVFVYMSGVKPIAIIISR